MTKNYFLGFSVWDRDTALDWDSTVNWLEMLGIQHTALIFDGLFDRDAIHAAWLAYKKTLDRESEGYVIRVAGESQHDDFKTMACKYVRKDHVGLGDSHWLYGGREIRQNGLKVVP